MAGRQLEIDFACCFTLISQLGKGTSNLRYAECPGFFCQKG